MPRTRSSASGNNGNDGVGCSGLNVHDNEDLPPPPPPTPVELMAMLAEGQRAMGEAMHTMAQQVTQGKYQRQGAEPNQHSDFKEFLDTKPPIFKEAEEPLQAEKWLNTLEQKFCLLRLTEPMKTEYASHQLQGPAGLMSIKHTEFMKLTQGTKSLTEYLHAFNNLSRYATEFVDTDAKKIASFRRGLGPKMMNTLSNNKSTTFNEFVSDALTQDNQNNIYATSKNWKRAFEAGASQSKALVAARSQFRPPAPKFRPPQEKVQTVQNQKVFRKAYSVALPKGGLGQGSSNVPPSNLPCWNSNKPDH
ncbi:uncharacterized protein [Miscanthus floridulus]|uniref:uncharacterized protein n=1 Tax=Miscanthus floridulus TaxID=154761 RepID=UPI003459F3EE